MSRATFDMSMMMAKHLCRAVRSTRVPDCIGRQWQPPEGRGKTTVREPTPDSRTAQTPTCFMANVFLSRFDVVLLRICLSGFEQDVLRCPPLKLLDPKHPPTGKSLKQSK